MSIILNNLWQSVAAILQQTISASVDTSTSVTLLSKLAFDAVLKFQIEATCKRNPDS